MDNLKVDELLRRMWITRKCRIETSERLNRKHDLYQNLIVYYSIIIVGLSIWDIQSSNPINKSSIIILIASIALSLFSMFVTSKNYKERYFNLKTNYLELDNLSSELKAVENSAEIDLIKVSDINKRYNEMLKHVENHDTIDYIRVMNSDPKERLNLSQEQVLQLQKHDRLVSIINILYFCFPLIILLMLFLIL